MEASQPVISSQFNFNTYYEFQQCFLVHLRLNTLPKIVLNLSSLLKSCQVYIRSVHKIISSTEMNIIHVLYRYQKTSELSHPGLFLALLMQHSYSENNRVIINNLWVYWPTINIIQLEEILQKLSPILIELLNDTMLWESVIYVGSHLMMTVSGQQNFFVAQAIVNVLFSIWMNASSQVERSMQKCKYETTWLFSWDVKFYRIWLGSRTQKLRLPYFLVCLAYPDTCSQIVALIKWN